MIPTRAELKAMWATNHIVVQSEGEQLVDAICDMFQAAIDQADAAVATANAALALMEARTPRAYAHFKYTTVGTNRWTVDSLVGCVIVLSGSDSATATITFATPIGDDKYIVLTNGDEDGGASPSVTSKSSTVLVIQLNAGTPLNGDTADFVVLR